MTQLGDEFDDLERDAERRRRHRGVIQGHWAGPPSEPATTSSDGLGSGLTDSGGNLKTAAGAAAGEVVDEFVENWGEAVRSGDYAWAFRETLSQLGQIGGAIGGPVGAIAGGAVALGLTTAFDAAMRSSQEAARIREAIRVAMAGASDQATEDVGYQSGKEYLAGLNRALMETATRQGTLQDVYGVDNFVDALKAAQDEADNLGVSSQLVQDIYAGTVDQTKSAVTELQNQQAIIDNQIGLVKQKVANEQLSTVEAAKQIDALEDQQDKLGGLISQGRDRVGIADRNTAAVQRENIEAAGLSEKFRDAAAAARGIGGAVDETTRKVNTLAESIRNLPDLDIGITQKTANALAARAKLLAE